MKKHSVFVYILLAQQVLHGAAAHVAGKLDPENPSLEIVEFKNNLELIRGMIHNHPAYAMHKQCHTPLKSLNDVCLVALPFLDHWQFAQAIESLKTNPITSNQPDCTGGACRALIKPEMLYLCTYCYGCKNWHSPIQYCQCSNQCNPTHTSSKCPSYKRPMNTQCSVCGVALHTEATCSQYGKSYKQHYKLWIDEQVERDLAARAKG